MKRSEMLSYVEDELKNFIANYEVASTSPNADKRREYVLKSAADSLLAMVESFGMLPPPYVWEPEDG